MYAFFLSSLSINISGFNQLNLVLISSCQEPKWQAGYLYTPADAIAQGLKTLSLNETRVLSRTISDWFRRFEA